MLPIKQNLTTVNYNSMSGKINKYIVVHYTGNTTDTAYNNTRYFKSVNRNASAHYFVDDNNIYQCVLDKDKAWHCGDKIKIGNGGAYYGICTNSNSIGIEMCCTNSDVSQTTVDNTIELVKYLMVKYNIPASNVIRHYDVTNKMCPAPMVNNPTRWTSFKNALGSSYTPAPSTPSENGYTGELIYQVYSYSLKTKNNKWLGEVSSNSDGHAGNLGYAISGIRVKPKYGEITVQVHILGRPKNDWLDPVSSKNYIKNDTKHGNSYSGIYGKPIDAIKIKSTKGHVDYQVYSYSTKYKKNMWLPSINSLTDDYAGNLGHAISGIKMK